MILQDVSASPRALLALHVYLAASSSVHDVISSEQTPTLYDTEYRVSAVMSRLSLYHVICRRNIIIEIQLT